MGSSGARAALEPSRMPASGRLAPALALSACAAPCPSRQLFPVPISGRRAGHLSPGIDALSARPDGTGLSGGSRAGRTAISGPSIDRVPGMGRPGRATPLGLRPSASGDPVP